MRRYCFALDLKNDKRLKTRKNGIIILINSKKDLVF